MNEENNEKKRGDENIAKHNLRYFKQLKRAEEAEKIIK